MSTAPEQRTIGGGELEPTARGDLPEPDRALRIAIINIMPRAETYEPYLLRPLARVQRPLDLTWIRLTNHAYTSSDLERIARRYVSFDTAIATAPLDGLILSGAPVEELAFRDVHYWAELSEILSYARTHINSTLGLCWGGLALAHMLGLEKTMLAKKLFGVFQNQRLEVSHAIVKDFDDVFWCAHSRHSGIRDAELERARDAGVVKLLTHGGETGYSLFESVDRRFVAHLGHPEYDAQRLVIEWERDSALGRSDVEAPANFDVRNPKNVWRSHRNLLFERWLDVASGRASE